MDLTGQQLAEIGVIAFDHEPDWDAVYEGADHDWCADTSQQVADYLNGAGLPATVVTGGFYG
jgi:hypothetical protein